MPRPALRVPLAVTQRVDDESRSVRGNCRGATATIVVEAFRCRGDVRLAGAQVVGRLLGARASSLIGVGERITSGICVIALS
jgi:hypothetical protein